MAGKCIKVVLNQPNKYNSSEGRGTNESTAQKQHDTDLAMITDTVPM